MKRNNCSYENTKSVKGNYWNYKTPSKKIVDRLEKKYGLSKIVASIINSIRFSRQTRLICNDALNNKRPITSTKNDLNNVFGMSTLASVCWF